MSFSKKGKVQNDGGGSYQSDVDWAALNSHIEEQILAATDNGENTNQVCFISGIVDTGTQPAVEPYTEYDLADPTTDKINYEKQEKLLGADFGCIRDEEKGKFLIPNKPIDSVLFFVDFPDILISYGSYFGDEEAEPKPYRTLLAGEWDKVAQITTLSPTSSGYGGKSRVTKLAKATGVCKELPPANFDLAELLGKPFTMDITTKRGGDEGQYLNVNVANIASKHKAIPFPDHNVEPFGISMEGGNSEDELKQVYRKGVVLRRLEMAEEWETSGLKKEIESMQAQDNTGSPQSDPSSKQGGSASKGAKSSPTNSQDGTEGSDDLGSDIPF